MKTSLANDFAVVRFETKEGTFYYRNISGEEFFNTVLNKFQKLAAGENYSHYSFILIPKQKVRNCNHFVKDGNSCKVKPRVKYNTVFNPSEQETAEKGASTRQAAKKRGGEGAAVKHWPYWLEREHGATRQEKHQDHTDQVQQG